VAPAEGDVIGRLQLAAVAFLAAIGPASAKEAQRCAGPAIDAPSHPVTMTPRLGISFYQDGERAALTMPDDDVRQPAASVSTVRLRRAPFEIRIPVSAWAAEAPDSGLAVAVSDEPCFEDMLRLRQSEEDTPFFGRYRAMADFQYGAGRLISAYSEIHGQPSYGWNNLFEGRFNASGDGYRGVLVSRIDRRYGDDDLMQGDDVITLVFYLDRQTGRPATVRDENGEHDVIDTQEVDVVRIVLED
jgi:hypothetical protein